MGGRGGSGKGMKEVEKEFARGLRKGKINGFRKIG